MHASCILGDVTSGTDNSSRIRGSHDKNYDVNDGVTPIKGCIIITVVKKMFITACIREGNYAAVGWNGIDLLSLYLCSN